MWYESWRAAELPARLCMKRIRHTAEQIVKKLHQAASELAAGKSIEEVCKALGISPATYHRWQKEYGGADINAVRDNKALKEENTRLKKLVADMALDNAMLKELAEGKG